MRTYPAVVGAPAITVKTKKPVAFARKSAGLKIEYDIAATACGFSVHSTIARDVVHGQKARVCFSAALTFAAELLNHGEARGFPLSLASFQNGRPVRRIPDAHTDPRRLLKFWRLPRPPFALTCCEQIGVRFASGFSPRVLNLLVKLIPPRRLLFIALNLFGRELAFSVFVLTTGWFFHAQKIASFVSVHNSSVHGITA